MQKSLREIIHGVKSGDRQAFRILVEQFQEKAFRLAFRMLGDEDDARDVTQESFIKMWQKFQTYDTKEKFSSWMFKIVSNTAIDRMRTQKRNPCISIENMHFEIQAFAEDGSHARLENAEAGKLIRALTENLPEKQRIVFSLRDLEGLSAAEVGEITGYSEEIIKSNLYHARKSLKEKLMSVFTYERREP